MISSASSTVNSEDTKASATSINQSQEKAPLCPRSTKSKAVMIDQRYEIKKKIDEGTYAKVYLAQDWQNGGQQVVMKVLRPRAYVKSADRQQVQKEIKNHGKLEHKNILRLLGHSYNGVMHVKGQLDNDN